ncbi:MAG: leucine-rich repeat domain-containing protein [Treponema sp.]|jgi:hypothetical protein|nr:leucine-rich repeat domain-containing protein [Treponema sp.]
MKKIKILVLVIIIIFVLFGCSQNKNQETYKIEENDNQKQSEIVENHNQIDQQIEMENEFKLEDYIIAGTHDHIGRGNIGITQYQYTGKKPDIEIPSIIRGSIVTEIEGFNDKELSSVIIPNNVVRIGEWAFMNNNITNIIIPSSVRVIMDYAFYNNQLSEVVIPDNVRYIGMEAFTQNQIFSITIGSNVNLAMTSPAGKEGIVFDNDFDEFYENNGSKEGTYIYVNGNWNKMENLK